MKLFFTFLLLTGCAWTQTIDAPSSSTFFHDKAQMGAAAMGMSLRAIDLGQTVYHLNQTTWYEGKAYHGRETWLPTQNKSAISVAILGSGALTTYGQYRLYRAGHKRMAIAAQLISAGISSVAIYKSFHSTYTVSSR